MKIRNQAVLFTLFLSVPTFLWAACKSEADIKAADDLWASTLATHDASKVDSLYKTDAILLATYDNTLLMNSADRKQYFSSLFTKVPNISVEYDERHVTLLTDAAVSTGLYTFVGDHNGKKVPIPARYTFVYEATDKGCILITHHSSVLPVDFEKMKALWLKLHAPQQATAKPSP